MPCLQCPKERCGQMPKGRYCTSQVIPQDRRNLKKDQVTLITETAFGPRNLYLVLVIFAVGYHMSFKCWKNTYKTYIVGSLVILAPLPHLKFLCRENQA